MLTSLLAVAFAQECPKIDQSLRRAEQDAIQYYLADAEKALQSATSSFQCSETTAEEIVRFWLIRGMIADLTEDAAGRDASLGAAKALRPQQFTSDLGEEIRAQWKAADPAPLSPSIDMEIRGLKRGDVVRVDNEPADPPTSPPGLHVVQVLRGEEIVWGRVIEAVVGESMQFDMRGSSAPVPTGPTENQAPVGVVGLSWSGPVTTSLGRFSSTDGNGLNMNRDILPLALLHPEGRNAWNRRRANTVAQLVGLGLLGAGVGVYTMGEVEEQPGVRALGVVVGAVAVGWEFGLQARRRKHRRDLMTVANRAFEND